MPIDKDTWKRGAIYRLSRARKLSRAVTVSLLETRGNLGHKAADQLVGFWLTHSHYQNA